MSESLENEHEAIQLITAQDKDAYPVASDKWVWKTDSPNVDHYQIIVA
jgi:hypothetical protein